MGYTTDFSGRFLLSKQPTPEQVAYINRFADTRRVKRNAVITATYPDPIREAVGLPVGHEGAYYVGDMESGRILSLKDGKAQDHSDIIDNNTPPGQFTYEELKGMDFNSSFAKRENNIKENRECQPGLWVQWRLQKEVPEQVWNNQKQAYEFFPNDSDYHLVWDGGEKFYNYVEWLQYLINHFFDVWGIKLSGEVSWQGEDSSDLGLICVEDSVITIKQGKVVYE